MKKTLCIAAILFFSINSLFAATSIATPSKIVAENFHSSFPEVKRVQWTDIEDGYMAYFKEANRTTRIEYDLRGKIIQSIENYEGSELPLFLRIRVKEAYPNKNIKSVTEFTTTNNHVYQIILEDGKYLYNVRGSNSGNLTLESKFHKS